MAYGTSNGGGSFGDSNRDGIDDDIDRRPGNSGNSAEYARKYDRRSEQEFTNRMETANQIEGARIVAEIEERNRRAFSDIKDAQNSVHFFPSVGKFVIPEENTWAAHVALVQDDETELGFNPSKYIYFDKIVAQKFGNPALYDPNDPNYEKFEGLRTNLEVMRNDIIGMYLDDESFDPGDEIYIPKIASIAAAIGHALSADKWYKRPFMRSMSVDVANVEGIGAREMYKHLHKVQDKEGQDTPLYNYVAGLMHIPNHSWQLPSLEETPYSEYGLSAPPPIDMEKVNKVVRESAAKAQDIIDLQIDRVEKTVTIARRLNSPESLSVPTQEDSIEEARIILRSLKNLPSTDKSAEEWLDIGSHAVETAKSEALSRLIELYGGQLKMATEKSPSIVNSMVINSASSAAGALAVAVAGHTLDILDENNPRIPVLEDSLTGLPADWMQRQNHSVTRLLEMVETGMEWASGKTVSDKPSIDRLVEMSNRIQVNARKLQSIETLQAPARIESVELAREILRKMKGLDFADKPAEELIAPGNTDSKAALAQQVDEMVEIYSNLLAEAAQQNPEIMKDKRILDANDAVGEFSHTISLMAAKELPASAAAAQQINADIAEMPDKWKGLDKRTIDRLINNMEDGLQETISELQEQQDTQAKNQDEELAAKTDEGIDYDTHSKWRKRKRGSDKSQSALTMAAKRRNAGDLNGDGVADNLQGLGLNDGDLVTIKKLGHELRNLGNQANKLPVPDSKKGGNPLGTDGRTFAERANPVRAATEQKKGDNLRNTPNSRQ